jgi:hypothetical protein
MFMLDFGRARCTLFWAYASCLAQWQHHALTWAPHKPHRSEGVMNSEIMSEVLPMTDGRMRSWPTAMDFEFAYQARVAMDRIRFAIKHADQFGKATEQMQEAGFQLLDALQRLESADRRFQELSRVGSGPRRTNGADELNSVTPTRTTSSAGRPANGSNARDSHAASQKTSA